MTPQFPDRFGPQAVLLARYLSGECTTAECQEIDQRIAADAAFADEVTLLRAAWAERRRETYDASALWERVARDTVNAASTSATAITSDAGGFAERRRSLSRASRIARAGKRPAYRFAGHFPWAALAAALVLTVGPLSAWLVLRPSKVVEAPPVEIREVATRRAQQAEVYLSDGTRVILGVASKLRFAGAFGATRDVYLEGEAYFDVAHDNTRPFAVHTERGVARDLGTKFSVRSYMDDRVKELEVIVEEGIVALGKSASGDSVLLLAKDLGRVNADGTLEAERGVDVRTLLGWTEGRLAFRNMPLRDALPVLARWFDVNVSVGDSTLADYPITLTLTSERFSDAVDVLTRALGARVERRGDDFIFHPVRP